MGGTVSAPVRAAAARDEHGGSLFPKSITLRIEQFPGGIRETIQVLEKPLDPSDMDSPILPITHSIDLLEVLDRPPLHRFEEAWETNLPFSENHIIDKGALKNTVRVATDVGSAHDDDLSPIPPLDDAGDLKGLSVVGGEGGGDTKHIGFRRLDGSPDLSP